MGIFSKLKFKSKSFWLTADDAAEITKASQEKQFKEMLATINDNIRLYARLGYKNYSLSSHESMIINKFKEKANEHFANLKYTVHHRQIDDKINTITWLQ